MRSTLEALVEIDQPAPFWSMEPRSPGNWKRRRTALADVVEGPVADRGGRRRRAEVGEHRSHVPMAGLDRRDQPSSITKPRVELLVEAGRGRRTKAELGSAVRSRPAARGGEEPRRTVPCGRAVMRGGMPADAGARTAGAMSQGHGCAWRNARRGQRALRARHGLLQDGPCRQRRGDLDAIRQEARAPIAPHRRALGVSSGRRASRFISTGIAGHVEGGSEVLTLHLSWWCGACAASRRRAETAQELIDACFAEPRARFPDGRQRRRGAQAHEEDRPHVLWPGQAYEAALAAPTPIRWSRRCAQRLPRAERSRSPAMSARRLSALAAVDLEAILGREARFPGLRLSGGPSCRLSARHHCR